VAGKFSLRNFIIGTQNIPSRAEYKRLMLTGYMSILCILIAFLYAILDFSNGVYYSQPAYAVLAILPATSLRLIRLKRFDLAKIVLLISTNLVVFWSAINDPFETGVFLFFIPAGVGSFAILAIERYKTGFALAGLTTVLFFLAYFGDIHLSIGERPSDFYVTISFIFNYFISLTVSVLFVYFLMNLNQHSENELIRKEIFAQSKNAELQKVNEELDRFVYSVSHDLRSPLSSILGLTNLAKATTDLNEINQILSMIQGRVNAQDNFIKDIIDYARNARTETAFEKVKLKDIVNEVFESLKFNSNAGRILFKIKVNDQTTLTTDKVRLSIVLNNLVSNAIKYHDFRKQKPFVEVGYDEKQNAVYVQDNGTGIMQQHLEKIFEMFYRGSDRSTGSGLGLYITKEAVARINGRIEVESTYGEGSTFYVYLPTN
jgi:signal transduction histidine kinase